MQNKYIALHYLNLQYSIHNIAKWLKKKRKTYWRLERWTQKKAKKESVRLFISNLRGIESHNSNKSKRIYLLWIWIYENCFKCILFRSVLKFKSVNKSMFRRIFNEFNIGSISPAFDVSNICYKIDAQRKTERAKNNNK